MLNLTKCRNFEKATIFFEKTVRESFFLHVKTVGTFPGLGYSYVSSTVKYFSSPMM